MEKGFNSQVCDSPEAALEIATMKKANTRFEIKISGVIIHHGFALPCGCVVYKAVFNNRVSQNPIKWRLDACIKHRGR